MKTLTHYMSLPYPMEIIPDEGGYVASIPDLPGCMSSGTTVDEAVKGLEDAKELWIEGKLEDGQGIPEPTEIDDYSGKFVLRIPKSLHRSLDYGARRQGTSLNQYVVHLLSERTAVESLQAQLLDAARCWNGIEVPCGFAPHPARDIWNWHVAPFAGAGISCGAGVPQRMLAEPRQVPGESFGVPGVDVTMVAIMPSVPGRIKKTYNPTHQVAYKKLEGQF